MIIQYHDIHDLEIDEKSIIKNITENYAGKFDRDVRNGVLIIKVKKYSKRGSKPKYSINSRIEAPNVIASADAHDWDLNRALRKNLNKLEMEIQHKYKTEGKRERKPFKKAVGIKPEVV